MKPLLHACLLPFFLVGSSRGQASIDPCSDFDLIVRNVKFVLVDSELIEDRFVGVFEVSVSSGGRKLFLDAWKTSRGLEIYEPEVSVQFKDLNSKWVDFETLPGTFVRGNSRVEIAPGKGARIRLPLFTRAIAELSGSPFRVQLRANDFKLCLISVSFVSDYARPHVVRLRSEGR